MFSFFAVVPVFGLASFEIREDLDGVKHDAEDQHKGDGDFHFGDADSR